MRFALPTSQAASLKLSAQKLVLAQLRQARRAQARAQRKAAAIAQASGFVVPSKDPRGPVADAQAANSSRTAAAAAATGTEAQAADKPSHAGSPGDTGPAPAPAPAAHSSTLAEVKPHQGEVDSDDLFDDEALAPAREPAVYVPTSAVKRIDPAVLSSLPAGMQQEYLEELARARRMATRSAIMGASAHADSFSDVQLQAFLDAAKFHMQVKAATQEQAAKLSEGKRIASQANREYLLVPQHEGPSAASASSEEDAIALPPSGLGAAGDSSSLVLAGPAGNAAGAAEAPAAEPEKPRRKRKPSSVVDVVVAAQRARQQALAAMRAEREAEPELGAASTIGENARRYPGTAAGAGAQANTSLLPASIPRAPAGGDASSSEDSAFADYEPVAAGLSVPLLPSHQHAPAASQPGLALPHNDSESDAEGATRTAKPAPAEAELARATLESALGTAAHLSQWAQRSVRRALPGGSTAATSLSKPALLDSGSDSAYEELRGAHGSEPASVSTSAGAQASGAPTHSYELAMDQTRKHGAADIQDIMQGNAPRTHRERVRHTANLAAGSEQAIEPATHRAELLDLEAEEARAKDTRSKAARDADVINDSMREDVIRLLSAFGIPWQIAPMEAEAQCAQLEEMGLVDGVITDDSDAFLFGARHVYRRMFDERNFVEEYRMDDLQRELGLDRQHLIRLALLLGSDYTEGVHGVGIVNAVEILAAFPGEQGLADFAHWQTSVDRAAELEVLADQRLSAAARRKLDPQTRFMLEHRSGRRRWVLPGGFPSGYVIAAYQSPTVDNNDQPFTWHALDVPAIHAICRRAFDWTADEVQRHLQPALTATQQDHVQTSITAFTVSYADGQKAAKVKSRRLAAALRALHGRADDRDIALSDAEWAAATGRKRHRDATPGAEEQGDASDSAGSEIVEEAVEQRKARGAGGSHSGADGADGDDDDDDVNDAVSIQAWLQDVLEGQADVFSDEVDDD